MSLTKLLKEAMKDKQILQLIYPGKRPLNDLEAEILKICISGIRLRKLDMLSEVLKREGYIEKLEKVKKSF